MKCNICQQERVLNVLEVKSDEGDPYQTHICDLCWDSIYQIAVHAVNAAKENTDPRTPEQKAHDEAGEAYQETINAVRP